MDIITRAQAGLPAPSVLSRRTTPWAGITWHHTGGNPTTWKAIHNWQTDGRPEADELIYIGYSYGIGVDGRVTELRGWDYRAAGDHDNSRLQVVFMGNWATKLPPVAALAGALEFARYAEARAGKKLPGTAHRDVWPAGHRYDTDCPGNALYAWVRANLITIEGEEDDMDATEKAQFATMVSQVNTMWHAMFPGGDPGTAGDPVPVADRLPGAKVGGFPRLGNGLFDQLNSLRRRPLDDVDEQALADLLIPHLPDGVDAAAIAAAVRPVLRGELDRTHFTGALTAGS